MTAVAAAASGTLWIGMGNLLDPRTAAAAVRFRTHPIVNAAQRSIRPAISRAMVGPSTRTIRNRAVCKAMTNDMLTVLEAAAMMATESIQPGLVARWAVSGSPPNSLAKTQASPPQN